MAKLKVFSGWTLSDSLKQVRTVVTATSQKEAATLVGCSLSDFRNYWTHTTNEREETAALAHPGAVLQASSLEGYDFKVRENRAESRPHTKNTPTVATNTAQAVPLHTAPSGFAALSDDDIAVACQSLGWDLDAQEEEDIIGLVRLLQKKSAASTKQHSVPAAYLRESDLTVLAQAHVAGCGASLSKTPRDGFVAIYR